MYYLHTKFHDYWISSFREVAMTRFWDGRTDGRSDPTPRPAFAFGDAGKNKPIKCPCNKNNEAEECILCLKVFLF